MQNVLVFRTLVRRALAGSKDGSLDKRCEGFDQFSCSTRQRQIIGCQTSACLASPAFVEGPHVHRSMDAGARMSSQTQSDILKVEGLTRFPKLCPNLVGGTNNWSFCVFRVQNGHDVDHPAPSRRMETSVRLVFVHFPSSRGATRGDLEFVTGRGWWHQLSCSQRKKFRRLGVTTQHDQEESAHAPSTRQLQFGAMDIHTFRRKAFRV